MIFALNYKDPTLFDEINLLEEIMLPVRLYYSYVIHHFAEVLPVEEFRFESDFSKLLDFQNLAFDQGFMMKHSTAYITIASQNATEVSNLIERYRFELRLLDDIVFEECYVRICEFFDLLVEVRLKVDALHSTYTGEMNYLSN